MGKRVKQLKDKKGAYSPLVLADFVFDERGRMIIFDIIKKLDASVSSISKLKQDINEVADKLESFDYVKGQLATANLSIYNLTKDVESFKTDIATLKADVSSLKTDIPALKADLSSLKTDVKDIDVVASEALNEINERLKRLENGTL